MPGVDAGIVPQPHVARHRFDAVLTWKPRELEHNAQVYRAYREAAERLTGRGSRLRRVVLDYELKREYQRFLQERNRGRAEGGGRPDRGADEIAAWAVEHYLAYFDDQVHFPDVRIEYEDIDGRSREEDVEVMTAHYRGAHAAAAARSGFSKYAGVSERVSAGRGGGRGRSIASGRQRRHPTAKRRRLRRPPPRRSTRNRPPQP
jgi:hypothetical protein